MTLQNLEDDSGKTGNAEPEVGNLDDEFFSISALSMDDKVHRFLAQAVELAKQNSSKSRAVQLEPSPIYGSVIA